VNRIHLLAVGDVAGHLLAGLRTDLSSEFQARCEVLSGGLYPAQAFNTGRGQYSSTEILACMQAHITPETWRLLGVTSLDLYIPILTFVFGEAQVSGPCAVISTHRLRQEFYGLPPDPELLGQRMLKEAVHELGHTLGITHCRDYRCAMATSHAVEWIDVKSSHFCVNCRTRLIAASDSPGRAV
jgi:archaemetzincin